MLIMTYLSNGVCYVEQNGQVILMAHLLLVLTTMLVSDPYMC